jgi:hypothetical protein
MPKDIPKIAELVLAYMEASEGRYASRDEAMEAAMEALSAFVTSALTPGDRTAAMAEVVYERTGDIRDAFRVAAEMSRAGFEAALEDYREEHR